MSSGKTGKPKAKCTDYLIITGNLSVFAVYCFMCIQVPVFYIASD